MDDEINFADYYRILKKFWKPIVAMVFLFTFGAIIASLLISKTYRTSAVIMLLSDDNNFSGGMALSSMLPFSLNGSNPSQMTKLIVVLKSRTFAQHFINEFNLMSLFYPELWDEKTNTWKVEKSKRPTIESAAQYFSKDILEVMENRQNGTIEIGLILKQRDLADDVLTNLLKTLEKYLNHNAYTLAKKKRLFVEEQLIKVKKDLLGVGKFLGDYYKENKISSVSPNVDIDLSTYIGNVLFSRILNQDSIQNAQNDEQTANLAKLVSESQNMALMIKKDQLVKDVSPQVYLEYLKLSKHVFSELLTLMHREYELAKIEEAKEGISFHIIDGPLEPSQHYKPNRRMIVISAFFVSICLSLLFVVVAQYVQKKLTSTISRKQAIS